MDPVTIAEVLKRSVLKEGRISIDNPVFSLHYRLTVYILIAFALILGSNKYFGDPIDCSSPNNQTERIVDGYCRYNSYIIVPREGDYYEPHRHPVIGVSYQTVKELEHDPDYKPSFVRSYQWIEFLLFLQALLFFLPRYLWRDCFEHGRMKEITGIRAKVRVENTVDSENVGEMVSLLQHWRRGWPLYAWQYVTCELLNFANVTTQFVLLARALDLNWATLRDDLFTSESNDNAFAGINLVFPKVTRCDIITGGGAGIYLSPEICILPINVFTTKFYTFLWFYFLGLSVISGLALIYRAILIISAPMRYLKLKRAAKIRGEEQGISHLQRCLGYQEWFVLDMIGKNLDILTFQRLVVEYDKALRSTVDSRQLTTCDYSATAPRPPNQPRRSFLPSFNVILYLIH